MMEAEIKLNAGVLM
ncbi:Putative uncharacterized protein [Lactococcus lactis subsp. lactis A12]|uniref:Uncharacterized protein n=1 Tax=Lactococcus lactis subsp. lactis A12 TaxID=1137134 RepID=S6F323_LACLL|nr:Putative uncharacterized protein [Lactococcus lactis subsp. lactis A12]